MGYEDGEEDDDYEHVDGEEDGGPPLENGKAFPTEREARNIAAKKGKNKAERSKAVTGEEANFPTLGLQRSADPVLNMALEVHGRMLVFKWKQLVWMLRARQAMDAFNRTWRRPCRWLSIMLGRETAALWGHLGSTTRVLRGPQGPPIFR